MRLGAEAPDDFFRQIATLHIDQLKAGLLSQIGRQFLERLYRKAATNAVLIAKVEQGDVVGFVMGSSNPKNLYRSAAISVAPWLALFIIKNPTTILRAISLAKYAGAAPDGPKAELLSIAVLPEKQKSNIGSELLAEFKSALNSEFRVSASATQGGALKFYAKHGGVPISETDLGGLRTTTFLIK